MKLFFKSFLVLVLINFLGCKKDSALKEDTQDPSINRPIEIKQYGKVTINFTNKAGDNDLTLNTANYVNANGDNFTVSKFKYYISNIVLKKSDGSTYVQKESYHLIDNSKGNFYSLVLDSVPLGTYNGINFILGVDSARNTSGAQVGALDPVLGMFWTWNQGYIFLMMEGNSPNSTAFNNGIAFHLGGFTQPYNCIRKVTPSFGAKDLIVAENKTSKVEIKTDLLKMFESPSLIKFAQTSEAMEGPISVTIANNCVNMFSVTAIEN
jgi:hypothetical protein